MRESPEEEQALVEADYVTRIGELEIRELSEEFGDECGVGGVDAILGGFELIEALGGISGDGRHEGRDSVPQSAVGEKKSNL